MSASRHEIFILGNEKAQVVEHTVKFFNSGYTWGQKPELNEDGDWIASAVKIEDDEPDQN